jgi:hypothetical protein
MLFIPSDHTRSKEAFHDQYRLAPMNETMKIPHNLQTPNPAMTPFPNRDPGWCLRDWLSA